MSNHIITINRGSSSIKFSLYNGKRPLLNKNISHSKKGNEAIIKEIKTLGKKIDAIGHRIVFGGSEFTQPTRIDPEMIERLRKLSRFAPLHMPDEITLIQQLQEIFPNIVQVACFDTSFHQTLPPKAYIFPFPQSVQNEGIRRYGFHGLSFESIVDQLNPMPEKLIACHLGGGVSLAAIKNGKSIDTTMGLTTLGGVVMGTRTGDIDPGIILYLLQEQGYTPDELEHILYYESGLKGLSGHTFDMKTLLQEKTPASEQAIEIFCYQIAKMIGAYHVVLGGVDALVFTGGIGENCPEIRDRICSYLKWHLTPQVLPCQEERIIAKHTLHLISGA